MGKGLNKLGDKTAYGLINASEKAKKFVSKVTPEKAALAALIASGSGDEKRTTSELVTLVGAGLISPKVLGLLANKAAASPQILNSVGGALGNLIEKGSPRIGAGLINQKR